MSHVVANTQLKLVPDGQMGEIPPEETHDRALPDSSRELELPGFAADNSPHVQFDIQHEPPRDNFKSAGPFKRISLGLMKPLIAVATAQYFIVAVLAGLAAWTIASEAGEAINAKLEPLRTALKRF